MPLIRGGGFTQHLPTRWNRLRCSGWTCEIQAVPITNAASDRFIRSIPPSPAFNLLTLAGFPRYFETLPWISRLDSHMQRLNLARWEIQYGCFGISIWETIGCAISMIAQPHLSDMSILQTEHRGIRSPHPPPLVFSRRQEPFG